MAATPSPNYADKALLGRIATISHPVPTSDLERARFRGIRRGTIKKQQ